VKSPLSNQAAWRFPPLKLYCTTGLLALLWIYKRTTPQHHTPHTPPREPHTQTNPRDRDRAPRCREGKTTHRVAYKRVEPIELRFRLLLVCAYRLGVFVECFHLSSVLGAWICDLAILDLLIYLSRTCTVI